LSVFAFTADSRAPSISRFSAEWVEANGIQGISEKVLLANPAFPQGLKLCYFAGFMYGLKPAPFRIST
jgi:hypothetical protein